MTIESISRKDKRVNITLDCSELVKICNIFYCAKEQYDKDKLYHMLYSDFILARDLSQYGHLDSFSVKRFNEERELTKNNE